MKRLLVAYDSSDQSNAALDVAFDLARNEKASIIVCYALDVIGEMARLAAGFHYVPISAKRILREDADAILAEASKRSRAVGFKIDTKFIDAPPVGGITTYARRARADMIVIGSHGRSGLPRFILGSVAEGVMRHADVPVLVVRTANRAAKAAPRRKAASTRRTAPRGTRRRKTS